MSTHRVAKMRGAATRDIGLNYASLRPQCYGPSAQSMRVGRVVDTIRRHPMVRGLAQAVVHTLLLRLGTDTLRGFRRLGAARLTWASPGMPMFLCSACIKKEYQREKPFTDHRYMSRAAHDVSTAQFCLDPSFCRHSAHSILHCRVDVGTRSTAVKQPQQLLT